LGLLPVLLAAVAAVFKFVKFVLQEFCKSFFTKTLFSNINSFLAEEGRKWLKIR
jgi:hypothetical protein